ncbi:hypothetical protein, partial [Enterobacter kobei]
SPRKNSPGRWINHREDKTRMNTQNVNVKTAAHESSRKMGGAGQKPVTFMQCLDLFYYVQEHAMHQKQPTFFVPPAGGDLICFNREDNAVTVLVWAVDGWPVAASIPQDQFMAVLSGIPA